MIIKYTFDCVHNGIKQTVSPVNFNDGSFDWVSEDDNIFKRIFYNGKLMFSAKDDYTFLKGIEDNLGARCLEVSFIVYRSCDNGKTYDIFWEGYFAINDGEFDLDKCYYKVEPKPDDAYRCFIENYEKEINILGTPNEQSANALLTYPNYEFHACQTPTTSSFICFDTLPGPAAGSTWLIFHQEQTVDYDGGTPTYNIVYYREQQLVPCLGGVSSPPSGSGWEEDTAYSGGAGMCLNGFSRWVRVPQTVVTYNPNPEVQAGDCNSTFDPLDDVKPPRRRKVRVIRSNTPTSPTITGQDHVLVSASGYHETFYFKVTNNPGSTYAWSVVDSLSNPCYTLISGGGTNEVGVEVTTAGTLTVRCTETALCGTLTTVTKTILAQTLGDLGPFTIGNLLMYGRRYLCANSAAAGMVYSIDKPGSNYTILWAVTGAASIISGQGTYQVVIDFPTGEATYSVTCGLTNTNPVIGSVSGSVGASVSSTSNVFTPAIVGIQSLCPSSTGMEYSIQTLPSGAYLWTVDGGTIVSGQGTGAIIVDWPSGQGTGYVTVKESIDCGCDWIKISECNGAESRPPFYWCPDPDDFDITYNHGRLFSDVIQYMLDQLGCSVTTASSDFFNINPTGDAPGYVAGKNYVTDLANELTYLMMFQKSDVIDPSATEPATKALTTPKKLMEILQEMFQVYWFIDDNNVFRLEHISYFVRSLGFDLTVNPYLQFAKGTNKYSYKKETMYKYERYSWMEAVNVDFIGAEISYDSICASQNPKNNVRQHRLDSVTTDIKYINNAPDEIDKNGFVFMVTDYTGTVYNVISELGLISQSIQANAHLSWANLHYNYHRHFRVLLQGNMNLISTTFFTNRKSKKGVKVTFPYCCGDDLKPLTYFIRTGLGDGIVDEASLKLRDSSLTVNLSYE